MNITENLEKIKNVNALDILTIMLNTRICDNNCIVGDGDCFFHALEYAIGNCQLIPDDIRGEFRTLDEVKKNNIKNNIIRSYNYRITRSEVSKQPMILTMIEEKENELKELIDSLEGPPNPTKVLDVEKEFAKIQELENQIKYFKLTLVYQAVLEAHGQIQQGHF